MRWFDMCPPAHSLRRGEDFAVLTAASLKRKPSSTIGQLRFCLFRTVQTVYEAHELRCSFVFFFSQICQRVTAETPLNKFLI